jgi:hypothetical protein
VRSHDDHIGFHALGLRDNGVRRPAPALAAIREDALGAKTRLEDPQVLRHLPPRHIAGWRHRGWERWLQCTFRHFRDQWAAWGDHSQQGDRRSEHLREHRDVRERALRKRRAVQRDQNAAVAQHVTPGGA